jgi:TolB-like protein/Tfp pilus assembly protein PilF
MSRIISELKRRGVFRVAAAYALASWILIEAGSVLLPTFGAPEWMFRSYVIFVLMGFVISLIAAWYFQITPDGLQREVQAEELPPAAQTPPTSRRLNLAMIAMLVVALIISVSLNIAGRDTVVDESLADDALSIAVLPFTNRSNDPDNAIFVEGIHDDLLTKLANIDTMRVISRTSVLAYRDTTKNIRDIGIELGAGTILEGAVQRVGNNVRINMQLIDADTDEHLWAKTYDRELTAKNIFEIQSEISTEIASALKTTLSDDELNRMTAVPTDNIDAYRLVIAGRQNLHQRRYDTIIIAVDQFGQAISQDPYYADAYVGMANSVLLLHINHLAIPADRAFKRAQKSIDMALKLDPQNADAFATQGLLLSQKARNNADPQAWLDAEENYKKSLELNPSNAQTWVWYSSLSEQQNKFAKAIEYNRKSLELDPLGRIPHLNIARLHATLNNNNLATQEFLKGVSLHPDWPTIHFGLSNHLQRLGRLDEALAWSLKGNELDSGPFTKLDSIGIYFALGMQDKTQQAIQQIELGNPLKGLFDAYELVLSGDIEAGLKSLEKSYADEDNYFLAAGPLADLSLQINDLERVQRYVLRIHPQLDQDDTQLNSMQVSSALKLAYVWANQGEVERSERMLEKVLSVIRTRPRLGIAGHGIVDVQTLAMLGRIDEAMATFTLAVSEGFIGSLSFDSWLLSDDPYLKAVRNHPAYPAQIEKIELRKAQMQSKVKAALTNNDFLTLRQLTQGL